MKSVYRRFEKSSDTPDSTTEDFIIRLEYANAAIDKWENEQGIEWKELYGTISGAMVNGVFNNQTTLNDFKRPAGYLRIGSDKYQYVRPENIEVEQRLRPTHQVYTVTGSDGSYSINVYPAVSDNFTLDYRKRATKYTLGTETTPEIQMSDPEFIINDVLAQLYLDDDNGTQANVSMQIATGKMEAMRLANETDPFNNNSNFPDDDFAGFGN